MSTTAIRMISSMATRLLLQELANAWHRHLWTEVVLESVGGVDALRKLEAGASFDIAMLASDAMATLEAGGQIVGGSIVEVARSGIAVAVRAGSKVPDISTAEALRDTVLAAPSIGFSTGPSGKSLNALFEQWGIADQVQARLIQAPVGVPVGSLIASGEVALGFQQLSELMHVEGIRVVGPLPDAVQITTTFSAGRVEGSRQTGAVDSFLNYLTSAEAGDVIRRHGMTSASKATHNTTDSSGKDLL